MIVHSSLVLFISTFFFVSITPSLCISLVMSVGIRRTLWMIIGQVIGVVAVAIFVVVASVMLKYPDIFTLVKYLVGAYLAYIGIQMWLSKGSMTITKEDQSVFQKV